MFQNFHISEFFPTREFYFQLLTYQKQTELFGFEFEFFAPGHENLMSTKNLTVECQVSYKFQSKGLSSESFHETVC